jgi:protein-tyrosine phosphatase
VIDLHAHVLPGVDDGARDLPEALEMLRIAVRAGTTILCATPHQHGPSYDVPRAEAEVAFQALEVAARTAGIDLVLRLAAETWYRPDLPELARAGRLATYAAGGRRFALIEFPPTHAPPEAAEVFFRLRLEGVTPVIAHPERNAGLRSRPAEALALRSAGGLLQVTAGALTGEFRTEVRDCAKWLAKRGAIDLLASDAHRRDRRVPGLAEGAEVLARWAGRAAAERATQDVPAALLEGREAPGGPAS